LLSDETFKALKRWQEGGAAVSAAQADEIAAAMKRWAVDNGVDAYMHRIQHITGLTAEKRGDVHTLTGSKLILGEPDASALRVGGARAAFEARGYTAWDPSSPAFITETALGKTLCIPSIFVSYTGEALDQKSPLLRSDAAINEAALELLKLLGHKAKRVRSVCGIEQEFFLVDTGWYNNRTDLTLTGRTLIGAQPPREHVGECASPIKERVLNYMHDVYTEALRLGIPVAACHNEAAPNQYEFAATHERSSLAVDHNLLLTDIMERVARRHNLVCLLHEKPFAGVNGSGKHVSWSLSDDDGANLLNPGGTAEENLVFLTLLASVIHAAHRHGDLLRASAASAGNERRLGAGEAPPAIMSLFLGEQLTKFVAAIGSGKAEKGKKRDLADIGADLPKFAHDAADRNRTSPLAFTGAKFEFRMLGGSMNASTAVTVINAIVADSIKTICDRIKKELKGKGDNQTGDADNHKQETAAAVINVLSAVIKESKSILFDGDPLSSEWASEAQTRGLQNTASTPEALKAFIAPKSLELFKRHKILSEAELTARYNAQLDQYEKTLDAEIKTLTEMVNTQILPNAYNYQADIASGLEVLRVLADDMTIEMTEGALEDRKEMFEKLTADIYHVRKSLKELSAMADKARKMAAGERAAYLFKDVKPQIDKIRRYVDALEGYMPDEAWPLAKYKEMLFVL
jgi:glutamine synthetase